MRDTTNRSWLGVLYCKVAYDSTSSKIYSTVSDGIFWLCIPSTCWCPHPFRIRRFVSATHAFCIRHTFLVSLELFTIEGEVGDWSIDRWEMRLSECLLRSSVYGTVSKVGRVYPLCILPYCNKYSEFTTVVWPVLAVDMPIGCRSFAT